MSPQRQLHWANFWTIIGLLPFAIMFCWCLAAIATSSRGSPSMLVLDPFAMLFLSILSYVLMLAIAGPQLWWAWQLTSYHARLRRQTAVVLRIVAAALILSPWLFAWYVEVGR